MSLGGLVKGIIVIDTMNGVSQPRNPIIADVFYRLELIESCGTGIKKIFESYSESLRKPEIQSAPASFVITLPKLTAHTGVVSQEELKQEILRQVSNKGDLSRKDIELSLSIPKQLALKLLNELLEERKIKNPAWLKLSGIILDRIVRGD